MAKNLYSEQDDHVNNNIILFHYMYIKKNRFSSNITL